MCAIIRFPAPGGRDLPCGSRFPLATCWRCSPRAPASAAACSSVIWTVWSFSAAPATISTYSPRGSRSAYSATAAARGGALHFFVQLGQLPAQGDGPIPPAPPAGRQGSGAGGGGFVENEGMRQAADRLQGSVTLPFLMGRKPSKRNFAGGQAAGGQGRSWRRWGPGTVAISTSFSWQRATSPSPGSLMQGIPASVTMAPFFAVQQAF